jgi:hypothetical protein
VGCRAVASPTGTAVSRVLVDKIGTWEVIFIIHELAIIDVKGVAC